MKKCASHEFRDDGARHFVLVRMSGFQLRHDLVTAVQAVDESSWATNIILSKASSS